MSEENEFIDWQGGECPVDPDTIVEVMLSNGSVVVNRRAGGFDWQRGNYGGDIVAYHVVKDVRPKVEIPEGFTPWNGGERPVDKKVIVKVQLSSGGESLGPAGVFDWSRLSNGGDIVAYRVVEDEKLSFEIPEYFTLWSGGAFPVSDDTEVEVVFRNGTRVKGFPHCIFSNTANLACDIIAYRVIEAAKPKVEIPEGFTPWNGGKCPVDAGAEIDVVLRNGSQGSGLAGGHRWTHGQNLGDIIAYRVVKDIRPKVEIPEGFTPWLGGERPFDIWHHVEVIFDDGTGGFWRAGELRWNYDKNLVRNIIAYRDEFEDKKPQTARDTQVGGDHYKKAGIQPWDVVDTWPIEQQIGFHRGNTLKYVMRMGTKDENLREIRKAAHYLQKLVEVLEQKGGV